MHGARAGRDAGGCLPGLSGEHKRVRCSRGFGGRDLVRLLVMRKPDVDCEVGGRCDSIACRRGISPLPDRLRSHGRIVGTARTDDTDERHLPIRADPSFKSYCPIRVSLPEVLGRP